MADPVVTHAEQTAAFTSAKADLDKAVPAMFRGYIHDDMIAYVVFNALMAAAKVRVEAVPPAAHVLAARPVVPTKEQAS